MPPPKKKHLYWRFGFGVGFLLLGAAIAWSKYPGNYDWRYQVVSDLISPKRNPDGYRWLGLALVLCFSFLFPLCNTLRSRLNSQSRVLARLSFESLRCGMVASIAIGVERTFLDGLSAFFPKGHEAIALVAFAGLCIGILGFWWLLVNERLKDKKQSTLFLFLLFAISTAPFIGIAFSQAYLYVVPNSLGWVAPHWAEWGVPVYLSFAFWEWLCAGALFTYLFGLIWWLPRA